VSLPRVGVKPRVVDRLPAGSHLTAVGVGYAPGGRVQTLVQQRRSQGPQSRVAYKGMFDSMTVVRQ